MNMNCERIIPFYKMYFLAGISERHSPIWKWKIATHFRFGFNLMMLVCVWYLFAFSTNNGENESHFSHFVASTFCRLLCRKLANGIIRAYHIQHDHSIFMPYSPKTCLRWVNTNRVMAEKYTIKESWEKVFICGCNATTNVYFEWILLTTNRFFLLHKNLSSSLASFFERNRRTWWQQWEEKCTSQHNNFKQKTEIWIQF